MSDRKPAIFRWLDRIRHLGSDHLLDATMWVMAMALVVLLAWRALFTLDSYFDSLVYQLPFAARLAGICSKSCYQMDDQLEARFDGFPKAINALQAVLWRLTGQAQAVDVLNILALGLFAAFMRATFKIPPSWTLVGLLAVPILQINVTSAYVDLPVNVAVAGTLLALLCLLRAPERFGWRTAMAMIAALALAANGKVQMIPVALAVGCVWFVIAYAHLASGRSIGPFVANRCGALGLFTFFVAVSGLVGATALRNLVVHGSPIYPLSITMLGVFLPGPESASDVPAESINDAWLTVASPLRWLASVLEVGAFGFRELPWTFDQGYCVSAFEWNQCVRFPTTLSFRMGGYNAAYVLFLALFLVSALGRMKVGPRVELAVVFLLSTALAASMPRSHELRYFSFWMIVLVALCLISVFDARWAAEGTPTRRNLLGLGLLGALLCSVLLTKATYVTPFAASLDDALQVHDIESQIKHVPEQAVVCVDHDWRPLSFLFAEIFHPGRYYTIVDGDSPACTIRVPPRFSNVTDSRAGNVKSWFVPD